MELKNATGKEMLQSFINEVVPIALQAGKEIMNVYETDDFNVEMKSDNSPLTKADKAAHDVIKKGLTEITPYIPLLSEEGKDIPFSERKKWDKFWLVDPLDGTKEFIKKNGEFTVNIALIENNEPVLGVIFAPALGKLYYGSKGTGSFNCEVNPDFKITRSVRLQTPKPDLHNITAVGSRSHSSPEEQKVYEEYNVKNIISAGSSLKFCMLAEGKADIYYRHGPTMEWDVAAGCAILKELNIPDYTIGNSQRLAFNKENLLNGPFVYSSISL